MEEDCFEVEYYMLEDGTYPVEDFIKEQDTKMRAKLMRLLQLLELEGNRLREPYSKPLRNGIFEGRVQQSGNAARILYFFVVGRRIILTNGFIKKTRRTPSSQIELAQKRQIDFLRREGLK